MNAFEYREGQLHAESVPIETLAETYGTPLYVYSRGHLEAQYRALQTALARVNPAIYFAVKSNSNIAVIATLAGLGAGADVVSGGEILRARRAGVPAARIVFAGVGKTEPEIELALREGIGLFTVESEPELERISAVAGRLGLPARVALRVNPDVDPKTHKYTSTGKRENKFGVDLERAARAYAMAARLPGLEIAGLHMHLGSPLADEQPYVEAIDKVAPLCAELKARHPTFRHLDIGGGMGIRYRPDQPEFDLDRFARAVEPRLQALGLAVGIEPGRFLTGNAGLLVTRVQYIKDNAVKTFVIVDAAMTDLIRPALYGAYHDIRAVRATDACIEGDVVGPVCESGDFLAQERTLPAVQAGELLAVAGAGAYGFVMSSNYNSRPRAAEVMVSGARHALVRARETFEDLVRGEARMDPA
jgi:diaminopimelate decarboxylase